MSSSLDPDQARQNVRPDLDPTRLQTFPAEDTSMQRVFNKPKSSMIVIRVECQAQQRLINYID